MNTTFTNCAEKKAKQFFNLLQGYTKGIRITAILILLLMGVSNAWAATQRYIYVGISNNYQQYKDNNNYGFNFWGGTSGGVKSGTYLAEYTWDGRKYYMYRVQVYDDNNKAQFKGNNNWWDPGDGYSVKLNGTTNNAVFFSHNSDGWQGQFQQNYQETSTASLTASSTSVTTGTNVTLTPSLSSNATYNQIKSTTYTVSTNPNSGGSVTSDGVFSATKAGTYTVTATVTYNPKYFTGITKTASATQTIKVYDTQYVLRGSQTANGDPKGGMAGWDATNNNAYTSATINGTTMTIVATLTNAKTQYKFKIYNNFDGSYYGQTGTSEIPNNTSWTLNGNNDVKFTTTAAGSYTFIYNTSNKSIKVQYPTAYTVTYSHVPTAAANAPTTSPSISSGAYVLANTSVTFTAKVANTGYTWKGWYDNNAGTSNALSTNLAYARSITANTTIYAVYTANTYTVEFDANGGSGNMSNQNFTYGTAQNLTANAFTRTGYTFAGWATSANGNKVYDDKQSVSNLSSTNGATVTLYAKWTPINYTITYNTNDGSGTMTPTSYTIETATFDLPTPTKAGFTFEGWYTTSDFSDSKVTQITKGTTGNKTFYAKWTAIAETKYTINITTRGNGTVSLNASEQIGASGKSITATPSTGYQFTGWECSGGASVENSTSATTIITATAEGTVTANFEPKTFTITYKDKGNTTFSGTHATGYPTSHTYGQAITLKNATKDGYLFVGWFTTSACTGTAVTTLGANDYTNDITLYAKWLDSRDCIFFYNNLGWSNVYVYFYSSDKYWDDSKGTGSQKDKIFSQDGDANHKPHYYGYRGKMTKIEGTNIWYYNRSVHSEIKRDNYSCVAFTKDQQDEHEWFWKTEVVRRGDYSSSLPMFVSMKADGARKNESTYYNHGYWMNYPTNTGYTLKIYDKVGDNANEWKSIPFEYSEDMMMPLTLSVSGMESGKTYGFKILRADDKWYGNNSTMTTGHSGDAGQTAWEFTTDTKNCGLTTTAAGTYVFTLKYGKDRNSNYNYLVGVEYPASVGDYRLAYKDNAHPFHPGHLLKKRDGKDTVSFFVHYNENPVNNENPVIILQQVTAINAQTGDITWNTISTTEINGISATGIYNFILEQSGNVATLLNTITEYDGDFYIRTDATAGGWGNFRQKSNKMTYTSYAENQEKGFNHYFVEWINGGTNVKFTIANDYSYCLSDSLNADDIVTTGNLPAHANVRFGWHSKTNKLTRAYISGSSNVADRYLVLTGDDKLTDMDDKNFDVDGLNDNEAIFQDMGNWIYQLDAKAGRGASIQLTARYNEKDQTFFNTSAVALAEEGNETKYPVRFIYDFKTNNLMAAWLLEEENQNDIAGDSDLNANMLLLRRHHDQAQQIQLSNTLRSVGTAYGVMTFEKDFVNDTKKSIYERALYWVSFPFDVRIRDVFGFGEYMDTWIMEYYDGEARAKNGAWVDSESYWTYITDLDYVLRAGVGYVLCLDLDKMGADSKVFEHTSEVSLYFPSKEPIGNIDVNQAVSITVPEYKCAINRPTLQGDRRIADSNWNVIGVPRFINLNIQLPEYNNINQEDVLYYYRYNAADNTYTVAESGGNTTFQTMQAYMVQYTGEINWWVMANWTPQQLAARRNANATPEKVNLRLEIAQDDVTADKTFIQLQEEGATADFDMNKDLTKIINVGTNIYTIISQGSVLTAGNVMPMSECIVPVGVKVDTEGEYTFRMPDGTEGMVVELIDYELETKTNLLLFDYTVDLSAGTCNDRFALHIQPNKSGVTTGIEGAYPQPLPKGKGAKFLIDGKLVIRTAEGAVYDAQGHVVQ